MARPRVDIVIFGTFALRLDAAELRRKGVVVHLPYQPLQVLIELVSRAGDIVTREDLRRVLWPDGTVVDFDHALNFCIYRIRTALGDNARSPRFVETVARRGYRFIAPVARVAPESAVPLAPTEPPPSSLVTVPPPPAPRSWRWRGLAGAAVALAVSLTSTTGAWPRDPAAVAAFTRGQLELARGGVNVRHAVDSLSDAVRRDPRFAAAHAALAAAYVELGRTGELPPAAAFSSARHAALASLALEDSAEARSTLAFIEFFYDWNPSAAERDLARADAMTAARSVCVDMLIARVASATGRDREAIAAADRAEAASPADADVLELSGVVRLRAGLVDAARHKLAVAVSLRATIGARVQLFNWIRRTGDTPSAVREARDIMTSVGAAPQDLSAFDALSGEQAVHVFLRGMVVYLAHASVPADRSPARLAALHAALGDRDAAVAMLERAATEEDPSLIETLADPDLAALADDPRFQALQRRARGAAPREDGVAAPGVVPAPPESGLLD